MTDDFAEWRDNIESRVSTLEVTVETEARVRAQMDKDFSELSVKLDVQDSLLKALRETQSDHTATLRDHTATLRDHTATLRDHTATLRDHTERLQRLEVGQATVLAGVQTIIGLLDREIDVDSESGEGPGISG
jgi:septal ring factor EnvC (AmiA/AmiB activator)